MKSLKYYYKKAKKERWAMGQFNFSLYEQMRAIILAGYSLKSPLILGTSEGEANFFGLKEAVALKRTVNTPVFLNLDHGKDIDFIKKAIDTGYDSVHFDGSSLDINENIRMTKKIVSYARKRGVLVEGEIGVIEGNSGFNTKKVELKKSLTSPEDAKLFFEETGVDLLAVAIGNVHGIYPNMPKINLNLLSQIEKETSALLVLHGASGLKNEELKKAIQRGIVKVNINTELRKAWKDSLSKEINSDGIKPYNILPKVIKDVENVVLKKMKIFNSCQKV